MNATSFHNLRAKLMLVLLLTTAWSTACLADDIHEAAARGDVEAVRAMLKENPHLASKKNRMELTPLHLAARDGHADVVALLLANKADVNAMTHLTAETPLLLAAERGHADVVKLLPAAGAKKDAGNVTMLMRVSASPAAGFGGTALVRAACAGYADVVKLLLEAGANKEAKDAANGTALVRAAQYGHANAVRLLLAAGADKEAHVSGDVSYTEIWQGKVTHFRPGETFRGVSLHGDSITATMTQSNGVISVSVTGRAPQTALVLAARNGSVEIVKLLLEAGANLAGHKELYSGQASPFPRGGEFVFFSANVTALDAAKEGNHPDVVQLLTAAGAKE